MYIQIALLETIRLKNARRDIFGTEPCKYENVRIWQSDV